MPLEVDSATLDSLLDGVIAVCDAPQAAEPLRKWTEEAAGELGRNMTQGRSPDGTPFKPLSPRTIARRQNKAGPPLINQGDLLASLIGDGSGHFEEVGDREATLGTMHNKRGSNPPVAVVHQLGSEKRNIPARPFVGVNEAMAEAGEQLIGEWIEQALDAI